LNYFEFISINAVELEMKGRANAGEPKCFHSLGNGLCHGCREYDVIVLVELTLDLSFRGLTVT